MPRDWYDDQLLPDEYKNKKVSSVRSGSTLAAFTFCVIIIMIAVVIFTSV